MTSDPENPLLLDILTASPTAYVYKPDEQISEVRIKLFHFKTLKSIQIGLFIKISVKNKVVKTYL